MAASIGRIVHVLVAPSQDTNGAEIAPAIITRVWSETAEKAIVNYRILLDGRDTVWVTSADLYADEQAARAANAPSERAAFWPPRV